MTPTQRDKTRPTVGNASVLRRSFDVYYRDAARTERMDALNAQFVPAGGLAFDIGAHVGDRTGSFLRLGARVVALEPQPRVFRALRLLYHQAPRSVLLRAAIGAASGTLTMRINSANPTVSTASEAFVANARSAEGWRQERWDASIEVDVTTLDQLIGDHGVPDFVKIDVEGYELEALKGLSVPVPALSFEFTTLQRDVAHACLSRLDGLGPYDFNLSLGESHTLCKDRWVSAARMSEIVAGLDASVNSGDIFARCRADG